MEDVYILVSDAEINNILVIENILKPIINEGTLNFFEILVELFTRKSPPVKSKERPIKNKK